MQGRRIERDEKYAFPSKYITEYLISNCFDLVVGFMMGLVCGGIFSLPLWILAPRHPLAWFVLPIAAIVLCLRSFTDVNNALVNACSLTLIAWSFIAGLRVGTITAVAIGIVNIIMILALPNSPPPD